MKNDTNQNIKNKTDHDVIYTLEFQNKQDTQKRNIKKLIYAIILIIIVCGAAWALIFGIKLAKEII